MRFLIDMNLSPLWVERLETAGFSAVHWSSVGTATATDTEIMVFARTNDFVVLTHDLDFGAILAATQGEKPSVVQIRTGDLDPNAIAGIVVDALRDTAADLQAGALVSIDLNRTRVRVLPLWGQGQSRQGRPYHRGE